MDPLRPIAEKAQSLWQEAGYHSTLKIVGGVAAAIFAWVVIANFSDIKRYIRISTM